MLVRKINVKGFVIMGKSKIDKEALQAKIQELLEKEVSKFKDVLFSIKVLDEENEVAVEPFALCDVNGDTHPISSEEETEVQFEEILELNEFSNLSDVLNEEVCPSVEINEEDIEYIKEDEPDMIKCVVNDKIRLLVDKSNCNIKRIPVLGVNLVSPINLLITDVYIDSNMKSQDDIEVTFCFIQDNRSIMYKFDIGSMLEEGIVSVVENLDDVLELSPVEYRGLIEKVNIDEINDIILKGVF
jgi:hypothetical protein